MHQTPRRTVATTVVAAFATLAALTSPGFGQTGSKPPAKPAAKPATTKTAEGGGVLGYLAIPDLDAVISHAEALAETVNPGKMPPGSGKMMLGAMLGDPGLAQIRPGDPLVFLVFTPAGGTPPSYAWLVPVKDGTAYAKALVGQGWQTRVKGGLLVAGPTPAALDQADAERRTYDRIKGLGLKSDARIMLRADVLMQTFGPMAQMAFESAAASIPTTPGATPGGAPGASPEMQKLVKVEGKVFLDLFGQVAELRTDLSLGGGAVGFDTEVVPKPATTLADLAQMAPATANNTSALLPTTGTSVMSAIYQMDAPRFTAFAQKLVDGLASDPDAAAFLTPEVRQLIANTTWFDGRASYRMRTGTGGKLAIDMAMGVTDEAKALASAEAATLLMAPGGSFAKMYEGMGISYKAAFARNARQHGGVSVHRLKVTVAAADPKKPAPQLATMKAMASDMDIAITHGLYLASQDPVALDAMIDRAAKAPPAAAVDLRSMTQFGPGAHFYCDYDLIGLLRAMAPSMPDAKLSIPANIPSDPMLLAGTMSGGTLRFRMHMPLAPFVALGQAAAAKAQETAAPGPKGSPSPRPKAQPTPKPKT